MAVVTAVTTAVTTPATTRGRDSEVSPSKCGKSHAKEVKTPMATAKVTVTLPMDTYQRLREEAARLKVAEGRVMRLALETFLDAADAADALGAKAANADAPSRRPKRRQR